MAGGGEKVRHRGQIKSRRAAGVNSSTFVCVWILKKSVDEDIGSYTVAAASAMKQCGHCEHRFRECDTPEKVRRVEHKPQNGSPLKRVTTAAGELVQPVRFELSQNWKDFKSLTLRGK